MEKTFAMIKPDGQKRHLTGAILQMIEQAGFRIAAMKMIRLTEDQAKDFYAEHKEKPFFGNLVKFLCLGPVVVMILEAPEGIQKYRKLMGATDPEKADPGTIRKAHGLSLDQNTVHGSDSPSSAMREMAFFFGTYEHQIND